MLPGDVFFFSAGLYRFCPLTSHKYRHGSHRMRLPDKSQEKSEKKGGAKSGAK